MEAATGNESSQCTTRTLPLLEFSDPCFIRVSSVAQNRLILIRMTRAVYVKQSARKVYGELA